MRPDRLATIQALSAPTLGVISRATIVAAGLPPELPAREIAAGRWRTLLPGTYLTAPGLPSLRQRCHAALLHVGGTGVITGNAGCLLRGVPGADPDDVEVTVLVPSRVRRVGSGFCRVIRTTGDPDHEALRSPGRTDLRVAPTERCVADSLRRAPDLAAARARGAAAVRHAGVVWEQVLAQALRPGPGSGHLPRAARDIADGVRSPAEGEVHDAIMRAAKRGTIPPYLLNPDVYVDGELIGSPDMWIVGLGLGNEVDSRQWHGSEDQLDATLARHNRFGRVGLHLHHVTPTRFRADPRRHVAEIARLSKERRGLEVPEPPGLLVLGRGPLLPARTPWPSIRTSRPR